MIDLCVLLTATDSASTDNDDVLRDLDLIHDVHDVFRNGWRRLGASSAHEDLFEKAHFSPFAPKNTKFI